MGLWKAWIVWWRKDSQREAVDSPAPGVWATAPVTRIVPADASLSAREWASLLEYPVPSYEDIVLSRRRLPTEPVRALEVARRAAASDPVVRQRVLGTEAAQLALCEAVELAVLQRISEGRTPLPG